MAAPQTNGEVNGHYLPALSHSAEEFLSHNYDYIIIGGGTAGLVVAARLTENPDVTVGVLEAGTSKLGDMLVDCPAMFLALYGNPDYDWAFKTVPQKHNKNKIHHIVRGKALGGSSAINYMMYVRGSSQDYNDWAAIVDDPSWGSQSMNEYMRKSQTLEPIDENVVERATMPFVGSNHGTSGPVRTSFNSSYLPIEHDFIKACDEVCGFTKKPADPWSGDHIGFFNTLGLVARTGPNKGNRSYAARGYFEANAGRPNLHVLCGASVISVELDGNKAIGANFSFGSCSHKVKANREVIVSCGTIQSPQILELSGIGDPDVLRNAGIECKVVNKAVGANFQDHALAAMGWKLAPGVTCSEIVYFQPEVMEAFQKQYVEEKTGPLTNISSTQGFFPYKLFATESEQAEVIESVEKSMVDLTPFQRKQYECTLAHLKDDKSANVQMAMVTAQGDFEGNGVEDQSLLWPPPKPEQGMGVIAASCLAYPLSRGTIHVKSADPNEHPTIDPAFMSHPADAAVLAAGLKMFEQAAKTEHLSDKLASRYFPKPDVDMTHTKQARDSVYDWHLSEYHPIGSCAMGDCVDTRLRVNGTRNLRVVDASVFPNHVSGNIVASVYAVAEKAADIVKADWDYAALAKAA